MEINVKKYLTAWLPFKVQRNRQKYASRFAKYSRQVNIPARIYIHELYVRLLEILMQW